MLFGPPRRDAAGRDFKTGKDAHDDRAYWKAFPPDSRTDQHPRPGAAGHGHARSRSSRSGIRRDRLCRDGRHAAHVPHQTARDHLSLVRHRRLGGRDRQHAAARRQGVDVRDRPVRRALARHRRQVQARRRVHSGRLAPWRRSRAGRGAAFRRQGAQDQGGVRGPQRDLDRLRHLSAGGAQDHGPRQTSGAVDGRHHLRPRLDGV